MATLRIVARLLALALALVPTLALHGVWRLLGLRSPWPRRYLASAAWIAGARVSVAGTPLRRDAVLLANHLTPLDIPVLAGQTGCAFVAKDELARAPVVGWLARLNSTLFVSRGNRLGVADQVAQLRAALTGERPVALFPEGGTGDGRLRPFKPALLAALDDAPATMRVQPVHIDYGALTGELVWRDEEDGAGYMRRILGRGGTLPVRLTFLAPFAPGEHAGRKAIAAEAHRRVAGVRTA